MDEEFEALDKKKMALALQSDVASIDDKDLVTKQPLYRDDTVVKPPKSDHDL